MTPYYPAPPGAEQHEQSFGVERDIHAIKCTDPCLPLLMRSKPTLVLLRISLISLCGGAALYPPALLLSCNPIPFVVHSQRRASQQPNTKHLPALHHLGAPQRNRCPWPARGAWADHTAAAASLRPSIPAGPRVPTTDTMYMQCIRPNYLLQLVYSGHDGLDSVRCPAFIGMDGERTNTTHRHTPSRYFLRQGRVFPSPLALVLIACQATI